jgi:PAS domain S-box-containing protein
MEVNSYFGVLLKDSHHKPIGTLCLLDHQTMIKSLWFEKIVQIFASRAAAELERLQATKALENINQELEIRVKERTADLLQNQEYLRQITENIESVFWMTNLDKNQMIYVSPAYEKIWGNNKEELYSSPQKWLQAIHPDDRQQVLAALPQQIKGKYNQEYRIIRPDGELRWIRDSAFPIRNQSGQIYRIAGIAEDITRQKQIEETLKLQERAIAASNNGIVIVDAREPNSPTVFVNPAFERITGYPRQEVIGQNCRFLQGQDVNQPGLKKLRTALKTGQSCTVNLRNYRKDGSLFWNELSISPIYDEQGRLTHYIGIQTDISERIQAEKSLKDSLREKEILLKEIHHRVKNNLLVVSSLLDWQTEYIEDPAIIKILEESQQRIHSMALIHEKLYQSKNLAKINFSEYLKTLVEKLSYSFNLEEGKIELDIKLDPVFLNIETATPCGLIVSELIANTFEHAFPENRKGKVCLSLEQHQHQIILTVADNGVGLPSNLDVEQTETLGLQLINLLAQQLRGKVTFVPKNGNNGTVCELIFSELEYRRRI